MQVIAAYVSVILIWSTTPLAIQWSNSSLSFITAVSLRMLIALGVCLVILTFMRKPLVVQKSDWKVFFVGALGLYPNMILVYWSAQYIPSGLMAVIFGISPFALGVFSWLLLGENFFNRRRAIALAIAVLALVFIHIEQIRLDDNAIYGVVGMTLATLLFSLSAVWLKAIGQSVDSIRQSAGVLTLTVPAFIVTWYFVDGQMPDYIDMKSLVGVGYLSLAGTVLGQTLFLYVLRHSTLSSSSLIPLVTPIIALMIGVNFADETISLIAAIGCAMMLVSLALHQGILTTFWVSCSKMVLPGKYNPIYIQAEARKGSPSSGT